MTDDNNKENEWHLSKSVPLALILVIFIQTFGAVWWASSINSTVETFTDKLEDNDRENLRQWARINTNEDNIQRIASSNKTLTAILERLEVQVKENNSLLKESLRGTNRPD